MATTPLPQSSDPFSGSSTSLPGSPQTRPPDGPEPSAASSQLRCWSSVSCRHAAGRHGGPPRRGRHHDGGRRLLHHHLPAGGACPPAAATSPPTPAAALTANAPDGPDPHQRLVVLDPVQEDRLRLRRAAARAPRRLRHLPRRPRHLLRDHARRSPAPRPGSASTSSLHPGPAGRRRRAERRPGPGRRLDGLDRHAVLGRRQPNAEGHHRPRPADVLLPGHRRRQRADHHRRPADGVGQQRRHDRLQHPRSRLRRLRPDRRRPGR